MQTLATQPIICCKLEVSRRTYCIRAYEQRSHMEYMYRNTLQTYFYYLHAIVFKSLLGFRNNFYKMQMVDILKVQTL